MAINPNDLPKSNPINQPDPGRIDPETLPKSIEVDTPKFTSNIVGSSMGRIPGSTAPYENYFEGLVPMHQSRKALDEARASNQTSWQLWKGTINQSIIGTIVGGGIEAFGNLAELARPLRIVNDTEYKWGQNVLQQTGAAITEWARTTTPTYMTARAEKGGFQALGDRTYWHSHMPSIVSSLSIMLPAFAAMKMTTMLGGMLLKAPKLVRTLATGAKIAKTPSLIRVQGLSSMARGAAIPMAKSAARVTAEHLGKSFIAAVYSRHLDNYQEANDVYSSTYEKYKSLGFDDQKAGDLAAEAAQTTYTWTYANLALDMVQWATLLKYTGAANKAINMRMGAAMHAKKYGNVSLVGQKGAENIAKAAQVAKASKGGVFKDLAIQGVTEGLDEYNIAFFRTEGERRAAIQAGVKDKALLADVSTRLINHTKDPHTFDSFFWGALGGITFGLIGNVSILRAEGKQIKETEKAVDEQVKRLDRIVQLHKVRAEAVEKNDLDTANEINLMLEKEILATGLLNGTITLDIEMLRNMSQLSNEQLAEVGFPPDVQENLVEFVKKLEKATSDYNKLASINFGYKELDSALATELAVSQYHKDRLTEVKQQYEKLLADEKITREQMPDFMKQEEGGVQAATEKFNAVASQKNNTAKLNRARTNLQRGIAMEAKLAADLQDMVSKDLDTNSFGETKTSLGVQLMEMRNGIAITEALIKEYERIDGELNKNIAEYDKVINQNPNKAEINKYIAEHAKHSTTEIQTLLNNTEGEIDVITKKLSKLNTREGQDAYIKEIKEKIEETKDQIKKDFLSEIKSAKTVDELNKIHENYNSRFTDEYKSRKREIEAAQKRAKDTKENTDKVNALATKIVEGQKVDNEATVEDILTEDELKTYNDNVDAVNKRIESLKTPVETPTPKTTTPKKVVKQEPTSEIRDTIVAELTALSKAVNPTILNIVTNSDGTIVSLEEFRGNTVIKEIAIQILENNPTMKYTVDRMIDELYLSNVNLYVSGLRTILNTGQLEATNEVKEVVKQIVDQKDTILADLLGSAYNAKVSRELSSFNKTQALAVNKHVTAEAVLQFNGFIAELKTKYTSVELPSDVVKEIGEEFEDASAQARAIANQNNDTKESKELDKLYLGNELSSLVTIAQAYVNATLRYQLRTGGSLNIDLETVFEAMIKVGKIDLLREMHGTITNLFNAAQGFYPQGITKTEGNNTVKFDFATRPKGITGKHFIETFIKDRTVEVSQYDSAKGTYVYLKDLLELQETELTLEQQEQLEAFLSLNVNSRVKVVADPNHIDTRFTPEENAARNNNENTVPVKIVVEHNGKDVAVGYIQSTDAVHKGIPYTKDGVFNPFSATINIKDAGHLSVHADKVKAFWHKIKDEKLKGQRLKSEFGALPEPVRRVITKMVTHNQDKGITITRDMLIHVLEPMFFNLSRPNANLSSLTAENVLRKYNNHNAQFRYDYESGLEIRKALAQGKEVNLKVGYKSITPQFNPEYKSINGRLAPIMKDDKKRVVIGHRNVAHKEGSTIYDMETGDPIPVTRAGAYVENEFYYIAESAPGVYHAFNLRNGRLNSRYGETVLKELLKDLEQLSHDPNSGTVEAFRNKFRQVIELTVQDTIERFNFKVNQWGSITVKVDGLFYEIRYNNKKNAFEVTSSDTLDENGGIPKTKTLPDNTVKKVTTEWNIQSADAIVELLRPLRRNITIESVDGLSVTFPNIGEAFVDIFGNSYQYGYLDYLEQTDALLTNLETIYNEDGEPISNLVPMPNPERGKSGISLHVRHDVGNPIEKKSEKATIFEEDNKKVSHILGKNMIEVLNQPGFKDFKFLAELLESLGIEIVFDTTTSIGNTTSSQLSITPTGRNKYAVNVHHAFVTSVTTGVDLIDATRALIVAHEVLHPIITSAESTLSEEQMKEYLESLKEFRDSLKKYTTAFEGNPLSEMERNRLSNYLKLANDEHSETITYAFTNEHIMGILTKISDSEVATTTKGFWQKLGEIITKLLNNAGIDLTKGKVAELTNILDKLINVNDIKEYKKSIQVDKTTSYGNLKNEPVYSDNGINVMRKQGTNEHFGNPFSGNKQLTDLYTTPTAEQAVEAFYDWLNGINKPLSDYGVADKNSDEYNHMSELDSDENKGKRGYTKRAIRIYADRGISYSYVYGKDIVIEGFEDHNFFIHKQFTNTYAIVEASSGQMVVDGFKTQKEAIANAKELLSKHKTTFAAHLSTIPKLFAESSMMLQDVNPTQRAWILSQIDAGKLDNQTLLYMKEGKVDYSHADALRDFVLERRLESKSKPVVVPEVKPETKQETKPEVKQETKPVTKLSNPFDKFRKNKPTDSNILKGKKPKESMELTSPTSAEYVWNTNSDSITARYGLTKDQFISAWSDLTPLQRIQEFKCL